MKTKLLTFVLPVFAGAACGQVNVDVHSRPKKITIETDIKIDSVEMIVPRGKYFLEVVGANSYTMKKGLVPYNPLSTNILKDGEKGIAPQIGKNKTNVRFGRSTEYTIIAVTNDSVPQQRKYVLRSQSDWSWTTTLGANAVIFTNRSKYLSKEENGIHSVTEM